MAARRGHYGAPVPARAIRKTSLMIAFLIPLAALAEDNPWVPAFSAFGGVLTQKVDATATSNATGRQAQGDAEITYPFIFAR